MNPSRAPLAVRVSIWSSVLGAVAVTYSAILLNWWWIAAAILALIASMTKPAFSALSLLLALIVGAWPAATVSGCALLAAALTKFATHQQIRGGNGLDIDALAEAVRALPKDVRHRIELVAGDEIVDTLAIVRSALVDDPTRWPLDAAVLGGVAHEGGEVGNTRWNVIAAESALMAGCRPDTHVEVTEHHLAAAGFALPNAAVSTRIPHTYALAAKAVGISEGQIVEQLMRTVRQPGAELIVRRTSNLAGMFKKRTATNSELSVGQWRALGRRTG